MPALPDSRKEAPSFFSENLFLTLTVSKYLTAAPGGPSTPAPVGSPPTPDVG